MSSFVRSTFILQLNYLVAFLIYVLADYTFRKCSGICGIEEVLYGSTAFTTSVLSTSFIYFWRNRRLRVKEVLYYYAPFLVILASMTLQFFVSINTYYFYQILPFSETTIYILIPAIFFLGFFLLSVGTLYAISRYSLLRKSLILAVIMAYALAYMLGAVYVEVQHRLYCNQPTVYCGGGHYLFPIYH